MAAFLLEESTCLGAVAPRLWRAACVDAFHCDGAGCGADEIAEIAADAFLLYDMRITNAIYMLPVEALMSPIFAGDIAKIAANAVLDIYVGDDVIVEIEVPPVGDASG